MSAMRIGFVTSEVTPFAKTGGLADVSGTLPRFLQEQGHDVRVFMPFYDTIQIEDGKLHPVDFLQNVPIRFGERDIAFSVFTTPLPDSELWIYLIACPELYHRGSVYTQDADEHLRFGMLVRATIESFQRMGYAPDVIHCNDWHTATLPLYLKTVYGWDALFGGTRTMLTIHNIAYQGIFSAETVNELGLEGARPYLYQQDLEEGRLNFLKTGILYADALTTVSPTHAREIQQESYGYGLHELLQAREDALFGILNGVDYDEWNPEKDPLIPCRYSVRSLPGKGKNKKALVQNMGLPYDSKAPVVGIVSRLTHQKGFDLCFDVLPAMLAEHDMRLVVLGSGEAKYEEFFTKLQHSFPQKAVYYRGYNNKLAHMIEAGADMFLMPSRYEPCGLNQMFSLRYGTIPIVRKTGGLADTVQLYDPDTGKGNGFVFDHFTPEGMRWALEAAFDIFQDRKTWRKLMRSAMAQDYSWEVSGREYLKLYRMLAGQ
ncbi:hypothetical protein ABI59_02505 [Acidobacteria bacterium Mor1]|nr:hypothetical protein ABI59_02505 [Acidobacteria bacterium Mor1]